MNRQVVPSMLLSVLIVCFFAVVLFPLEKDREKAEKTSAAPKAPGSVAAPPPVAASASPATSAPKPTSVATTAPAPPVVASAPPVVAPAPPVAAPEPKQPEIAVTSASAGAAAVKPEPEPKPQPEAAPMPSPDPSAVEAAVASQPAARVVEPPRIEAPPDPILVHAASFRPEPAPDPASEVPETPPRTEASPVAASTPVPMMPVRAPSPPEAASDVKENVSRAARPAASPARSEPVSIPQGELEATIVEPGETLEDVSMRVYGTRAGVETLLRANREVLTRRKGPVRAGLQLWTPER